MPRRQVVVKREVFPDPKHKSVIAAKFINILMLGGKKSTAERIFYKALDIIKNRPI